MTEEWTETSLTTLWTALEVLAHQGYHENIIDRVVRSVAPVIGALKIRDLTDDLATYFDASLLSTHEQFHAAARTFWDERRGLTQPAALLGALADKTMMNELRGLATPSPLMAYRIERYHRVVRCPSSLLQRVLGATRRVEWQLRRVYRLRNDIVHGAAAATNSERLHEHLDVYLQATLTAFATLLQDGTGLSTIEDAVALIDGSFQEWLSWVASLEGEVKDMGQQVWHRLYTPAFEYPYRALLSRVRS